MFGSVADRRSLRRRTLALGVALVTLTLLAPVDGAAGVDGCHRTSQVNQGESPWALQRLVPQRAWSMSKGEGVLVAVLGSGIDAANPQFGPDQVLAGRDVRTGGSADDDCDGSGTFVAGLIAAQPDPRTEVVGIAPLVRLLPIRVNETTTEGTDPPNPNDLAKGIAEAEREGARVVVIYEAATHSSGRLERAVARAVQRGMVIVAGGTSITQTSDAPPQGLFPCDLADVVGVVGVDSAGAPVPGSCSGDAADLSAPGKQLVSTAPPSGAGLAHVSTSDENVPGFAAGYVGAVAALVLSYEPNLSVDEVARRLAVTSDRAPSGERDPAVGWGLVNPYAAVSALVSASPAVPTAARSEAFRPARQPEGQPPAGALLVGAVLLFCTIAALLVALGTGRANRRHWRPGT